MIAACSIVLAGGIGVALWVMQQGNDVPPPRTATTAVAPSSATTVTVTQTPSFVQPPTTTTATPALQGADAKFITFLRDNGPIDFNAVSTTTAIEDAHLVCQDLQQDTGFQDVNDKLQNLSPNDINWFVNVVPGFYCPQFHND